jgi:hypothetical protein
VCAAQFTVRRRFTSAAYDRFKAVDLLVENAGISRQWLSLIAEGVGEPVRDEPPALPVQGLTTSAPGALWLKSEHLTWMSETASRWPL